jgi:hypothetical protein
MPSLGRAEGVRVQQMNARGASERRDQCVAMNDLEDLVERVEQLHVPSRGIRRAEAGSQPRDARLAVLPCRPVGRGPVRRGVRYLAKKVIEQIAGFAPG